MMLYAWLLHLYPRDFRERFGAGMLAAFTEEYARASARGPIAALLFVVATAVHTVWFALLQRVPTAAAVGSDRQRSLCVAAPHLLPSDLRACVRGGLDRLRA